MEREHNSYRPAEAEEGGLLGLGGTEQIYTSAFGKQSAAGLVP